MATGEISKMSWADLPLTGGEYVELIQGGKNVRILLSELMSKGIDGKSAFDLAKEDGFEGDLPAWLTSLKGAKGDEGDEGPRGPKGDIGSDGESAFEVYKRVKGYTGTEDEWITEVLEGRDPGDGSGGTDGVDGQDGADGESAYELYKRVTGWEGTEAEFAEEIKGEKGDKGDAGVDGTNGVDGQDGESAYELAVRLGDYTGSEEDFATLMASIGEGGTGGGDGGGIDVPAGLAPMLVMRIQVTDYFNNEWIVPEGVTIEKEYGDTSLRITHPYGRTPVGWSGLNSLADPPTMMTITSMRNMQVIDDNTFIITSVNGSATYELNVMF